MESTTPVVRTKPWIVLLGLFIAGLAMRPQVVGLGPLLPRITDTFTASHAWAGLLTTAPVFCMGLLAPIAPRVARSAGTPSAMPLCLFGIAGFGVLRAMVGSPDAVLVTTIAIGLLLGLAQALLPIAVKEHFAARPAMATGLYVAGIQLGAAISSWTAIPLADATGSWRGSLVVFSLAIAAMGAYWVSVWLRNRKRRRPPMPIRPGVGRSIRRRPVVWAVVVLFSFQSMAYYGINTWLASYYVETGWSEAAAGILLALVNLTGLAASLTLPRLADRSGHRRQFLVGGGTALTIGVGGMILLPSGAVAWVVLAGFAMGVVFPLILTLPLDLGATAQDAGAVSGLMLMLGYGVASTAPWVLGAVRDLTGDFGSSLWVIAAFGLVMAGLAAPLSRERLRPPREERLEVGA